MNENKIELLAPAGNYDIFLLALRAGADAVYFAGSKFGARAFANNFSDEEVIKAIQTAHLFQKKVYLTVNTLLKELELQSLYAYLLKFYEEGLDGVIVQDIGVMAYIREAFPNLDLHASTQMTVTGVSGIHVLESMNVKRVVLARELSLTEIKEIKAKTDMELEIFIHGAMCYSYSGQCLLSSILGGRSGNRGRCAQPCRLPYQIDHTDSCYPLSMKDQCAINYLEELIHIGVDSLKIEGRMKKPEYVVMVTAIYRKYIDVILKKRKIMDTSPLIIDPKDKYMLENIYVRTSSQNGYFETKNGKDMLTIHQSTYKETPDKLLLTVHDFIESLPPLKFEISCDVNIYVGEKINLVISHQKKTYSFFGDVVSLAKNQPLNNQKIIKQLNKTTDTNFSFTNINIHTDFRSFLPISSLNEIRRTALQEIEEDLLLPTRQKDYRKPKQLVNSHNHGSKINITNNTHSYSILISNFQQLKLAVSYSPERIYIPISLFEQEQENIENLLSNMSTIDFYLALPHVFRQSDFQKKETLWKTILFEPYIKGVLIRNLDEIGFLNDMHYSGMKQLDYFVYCMNTFTINFWKEKNYTWTSPLELNHKELNHLPFPDEAMVYGQIPLMISANCISKTLGQCNIKQQTHVLTDRMHKNFMVKTNCMYCYNVLYNCVPLSLHNYIHSFHEKTRLRLEFTFENEALFHQICDFYLHENVHAENHFIIDEYTNGHFNRGVD